MSDTPPKDEKPGPDLQELAKRYLDQWNRQMGAMGSDPALAKAMAEAFARSYEAMSQGMAVFAQGVMKTGEAHAPQSPRPRPQAADAASGGADGQLAGLAGRLAALEKRVAQLEGAVLKPGPGTGKRKPRGAA
ncbi:MAG: hypothetical protein OEL53_14020 [Rhodospirillales bacterium]|nr:hypothetical protein [Rhodospirillales bacterium]